jgi:hypothetical protein
MTSEFRIGIDFDSTIIAYDEVFCATAKRWGLIEQAFRGGKRAVRDAVLLLPEGEIAWQRLQGRVYGKGIADATMVEGFTAFLRRCRAEGCAVAIVSHKTEYGPYDPDRVNLHSGALDWMAAQGLLDDARTISRSNVYFESTREAKLGRIAALSLTHFIDDLEEVLSDPQFPPNIEHILITDERPPRALPYSVCSTWRDIERLLFAGSGV